MKKLLKIQAILLATILVTGLFAAIPLTASAATISVSTEKQLRDAVSASKNGDVISLKADITTKNSINISGKKLEFDLGKRTLTISSKNNGIVLSDASLKISGSGRLAITAGDIGISADNSTLSSTSGVNVSIKATNNSGIGISAVNKSTVVVYGSVSASGTDCSGVFARNESTIYVLGSIKASGTNAYGAVAARSSNIYAYSVSGDRRKTNIEGVGKDKVDSTKNWFTGDLTIGYFWDEYRERNSSVFIRSERVPDGWNKIGRHWYYIINGKDTKGWLFDGINWYFFDRSGRMQTGWVFDSGKWYHLDDDGKMQTGWQSHGARTYLFKIDSPDRGSMLTGWQYLGGNWYYFDPVNGWMATGWLYQGGEWYYLKYNGSMARSETLNINGRIFSFNAIGACINPY